MFYRAIVARIRNKYETDQAKYTDKWQDDSIEVYIPALTPEHKDFDKDNSEDFYFFAAENMDLENPLTISSSNDDNRILKTNTFVAYPGYHTGNSTNGSFIMPEVGDEVIVEITDNDTSQIYYRLGGKKVEGCEYNKNPKNIDLSYLKQIKINPAQHGNIIAANKETYEKIDDEKEMEQRPSMKVLYKGKNNAGVMVDTLNDTVMISNEKSHCNIQKTLAVFYNPNNVLIKSGELIQTESNNFDIYNGTDITVENGNNITIKNDNNVTINNGADILITNIGMLTIDNKADIEINNSGVIDVNSYGNTTWTTPTFRINGDLIVSGNITSEVNNITLSSHTHKYTKPRHSAGSTNTSSPVAGTIMRTVRSIMSYLTGRREE